MINQWLKRNVHRYTEIWGVDEDALTGAVQAQFGLDFSRAAEYVNDFLDSKE